MGTEPAITLTFSDGTLLGYALTGLLYLLLPAASFLMLRRRGGARLWHVAAGAIVCFLTVGLSDLLARVVGFSLPENQKALIAAELVCFLEEGGRWLAISYPITDIRSERAAVCLGIGHGGLECWIRGVQQFRIFSVGQRLNREGLGAFIAGRTPEAAGQITQTLQIYADRSLPVSLVGMLHAAVSFGFHIALSLLIYRKLNELNPQKRWLLFAMLLHVCNNLFPWLASLTGSVLLQETVGLFVSAGVIAAVYRLIGSTVLPDRTA